MYRSEGSVFLAIILLDCGKCVFFYSQTKVAVVMLIQFPFSSNYTDCKFHGKYVDRTTSHEIALYPNVLL